MAEKFGMMFVSWSQLFIFICFYCQMQSDSCLMNFYKFYKQFLYPFGIQRNYCTNSGFAQLLLESKLGFRTCLAKKLVEKYKLSAINQNDLQETVAYCKQIGFTSKTLLQQPHLLRSKVIVLDQRYLVLKEGGFIDINPALLAKFRKIFHQTVEMLKLQKYIPENMNVAESFMSHLNPPPVSLSVEDLTDKEAFSHIHIQVMKRYLMWRLPATYDEIEQLFRIYKMIQNKSFAYLCENIKIAQELGFTTRKLLKYGYLLHNYPPYTKNVLSTMPNLAGADLAKSMRQFPKLIMVSPKNYNLIYDYLQKANIQDETIRNAMNVFHLSPKTVKTRLDELMTVPEFKIHLSNPRILKLIVHQNRAQYRLNFLHELQMKCASLYILRTDCDDAVESYVKEGKDVNMSLETIEFVERLLQSKSKEIEKNLKLHPYYFQVPFTQIDETYRHLLRLKFRRQHLLKAVQILLYSKEKIDKALLSMENQSSRSTRLSKQQKLNLLLYYIERDHHFTGNGIWPDVHKEK